MDPRESNRIDADAAVCAGSGLCSHIASKYFDSSGGVVKLLREEVDEEDGAVVAEAVGACPAQALRLEHAPTRSS
jgi:ferredoxin